MNADQVEFANSYNLPATCTATEFLANKLGEELSPELLSLVSGGDDIVCW